MDKPLIELPDVAEAIILLLLLNSTEPLFNALVPGCKKKGKFSSASVIRASISRATAPLFASIAIVFSGWKQNKGLSNNALLTLVKKMDRSNITVHGFRSTFRDWAAEEAHTFSNETIELALAHTIKNKAEAAYRRGDQLERRRELMAAWDDYTNQHTRSKD